MGDFTVHNVQFYDFKPQSINCMAYDPSTEQLAIGYSNGGICIYNVRQEFYQTQYVAPSVLKSVEALCWLSGGRLFACGITGYVSEVDPRLGTLLHQVPTFAMGAWCMCADSSRSRLAVGTEVGAVCLYKIDDISGNLEFAETLQRAPSRILAVSWSQYDCNIIATAGMGFLSVVDLRHGLVMKEFPCKPQSAVVWDIVFLSDNVIASGDSTGQVVLWSIEAGGAVQRFSSHLSQVLCLEVHESSLYASGVDPVIRRYDRLASGIWSEGPVYRRHTHDVRTIAMTSQGLATGGLEGKVIIFPFRGLTAGVQEGVRNAWPLPFVQPRHPSLMSVSDYRRGTSNEELPPICALNYIDRLEIHRLGSFTKPSKRRKRHQRRTEGILPLNREPARLQVVVPRRGESLVCSAVSTCASWLAYSSPSTFRVLRLKMTPRPSDQGPDEEVHITRCRCAGQSLQPCRLLAFLPSSGSGSTVTGSTQLVCIQRSDGRVNVYDCNDAGNVISLNWHFYPSTEEYRSSTSHLLVTGGSTGDLIAVGCLDGHVYVYSVSKRRKIAQLPLRRIRKQTTEGESTNETLLEMSDKEALIPTALTLHPTKRRLLVIYTDRELVEFDFQDDIVNQTQTTGWFHKFSKRAPRGWRKAAHFDWLHYIDAHRILVSNPRLFIQLDTNMKVLQHLRRAGLDESGSEEDYGRIDVHYENTGIGKKRKLQVSDEDITGLAKARVAESENVTNSLPNFTSGSPDSNSCMRFTTRYQFILHVHVIRNSELVLMNMKPDDYALSLPSALYKKRYGV